MSSNTNISLFLGNGFPSMPNMELQVPTGSIVPHILLWVVQLIALTSGPFWGRCTLSAGAIISLIILSQIDPHFTNSVALAQPFTIGWSSYLSTLEKILFSAEGRPEASLWRINKPVCEALLFPAFGFQKLKWALVMMINLRGIWWNYEVKNVTQPKATNSLSFLIWQTFNLVYYMLMANLLSHLGVRFMFTTPDGQVGTLESKHITLCHPDWHWSFVKALVFGATSYYFCCMQYTMFSIPAVLLRLSKPEDWPPIFRNIRNTTTVRAFWGVYWHQTIHKLLTAYMGAVVDAMGIQWGTNLSSYTQLWLAFTISGCMHVNSMLGLLLPVNITWGECTLGMLQFFLWQAAAITVEDFVQWVWVCQRGRTSDLSVVWTAVGYTWVICSFWYSLPIAGDVMLQM